VQILASVFNPGRLSFALVSKQTSMAEI